MKLEEEIVSKFRNEHHKLAVNILYTHAWLDTFLSKKIKTFGLTMQQFNILRILRGQGQKKVTIKLISDRMLVKIPDVSRLVDRLVLKGYIERTLSKEDRRKVDVMITKKGLNLLSQIDKLDGEFDAFMNGLNKTEAATVNKLLDKLRG